MKAWTQPGPFPYNGRFNKLRYVNPWPQPLQKPHPPVWLAGGGSVETYEMAVNNDYTYNFLSFFGYRFAKKVMDTFWETDDRLGGDRNPYKAGFAQQICVAETDAQAEELYAEHVMYFFKKCLHVPPYYMETPGLPHQAQHRVHPQDQLAGRDGRRGGRPRTTGSRSSTRAS